MSVDLARARLRLMAIGAAAALACAGAGCDAGLRSGAPVLTEPPGSAGLQSTDHGVIWSLQQADGAPAIVRSSDAGRSWRIALAHRLGATLVASFFLGPSYAWVMQAQHRGSREAMTVTGTSDAGATWWRGSPLPQVAMRARLAPQDQLYFADPRHGWLLSTAMALPSAPTSRKARGRRVVMQRLWRTTDGGHSWTMLPARALPMHGRALPHGGPGCPGQPALAFANANAGWLTEGGCGIGPGGPVVWRTRTSGRHWVPFRLAAPPGGWASQAGSPASALAVGPARVINSRVNAVLLVPVADGPSGIVIEKSTDGGQSWTIAAQVGTGTAANAQAYCFDPLNKKQWVISAPGELIETADAGRTWTYQSSAVILPGARVSFTSLSHGFLQVASLMSAMATTDGGLTWISEPAPR